MQIVVMRKWGGMFIMAMCTLVSVITISSVYGASLLSVEEMSSLIGYAGNDMYCKNYSCAKDPNPDCDAQNGACIPIIVPCTGSWQAAPYSFNTCAYILDSAACCTDGPLAGCGKNEPCFCSSIDATCYETWIGSWWSTEATECRSNCQ